jgi:hypothetical protein
MIVALSGCHLLFPFEHHAPSDGDVWGLRQDQGPSAETTPRVDALPVDIPLDIPPVDALSVDSLSVDATYPSLDAFLGSGTSFDCDYSKTSALAPAGVCTVTATMTNTSTKAIRPHHFVVVTLSNNNLVLNANGAPGGAGATVSVAASALGADGKLTPTETFKQAFKVGLKVKSPFSFYVSVHGDVLP